MSADAAASMSSAGPPMKHKRPFPSPPEPEEMVDDLDIAAADEEKEQEGGDKDDTGKGKEESGILWTTLFSARPHRQGRHGDGLHPRHPCASPASSDFATSKLTVLVLVSVIHCDSVTFAMFTVSDHYSFTSMSSVYLWSLA
jgi:hypothetical protein